MRINLLKFRVLGILAATFLLCQCTATVNSSDSLPAAPATPLTVKKKAKNPYPKSTADYLVHSHKLQGDEKQKSLLLAAGKAISTGQIQQGAAILAQTTSLTPPLAQQKSILQAQIAIALDRPQNALTHLAKVTTEEDLPAHQKILFHELLAQAYQASNKPLDGINERLKLEPLLHDGDSQKSNHRKLWLALTHLPTDALQQLGSNTTTQTELQGWVQLALIARQHRDDPKALLGALKQWQVRFATHPARLILPASLDEIDSQLVAPPRNIALLLPLSGPLQGPGAAVKEGFMAAYQENHGARDITVKTYDTNQGDITALYQTAVNEGAEYVVGPLTKAQAAAIAALPHPVPTLLLNEADTKTQENVYSFSLSPVQEAQQVALKAHGKGYGRALIIAPNEWGSEAVQAFIEQWQKKGGHVTATLAYSAQDDLNKKMKEMLHVNAAQQREQRIKELLGYAIETVTTRRQDFDMIFLLAYPSKARQIMPLLKYYYAADVPVFATASVYSGHADALKDKDLEDLIFCDIPWVFSHQMGARNWPEQFNSYNRLYALGQDSYSLATQLNHLLLFPADATVHGDGALYLKPSRHIARVLEWGQFKQGLAHSLGEMT